MSFLQCEITCQHASHSHYCSIDPLHEGSHISVDVKHSLLCRKVKSVLERPCHLGTAVRSSSAYKAGQNPVHCQGSSAVALRNLIKLLGSFSSLHGSCLSHCLLSRACPGQTSLHFPPHLPDTHFGQRLEPIKEMRRHIMTRFFDSCIIRKLMVSWRTFSPKLAPIRRGTKVVKDPPRLP